MHGVVERGPLMVDEGSGGCSLRSSGVSLATISRELGCGGENHDDGDVAAPPRPLGGERVSVQFAVQCVDDYDERVKVSLRPWVSFLSLLLFFCLHCMMIASIVPFHC